MRCEAEGVQRTEDAWREHCDVAHGIHVYSWLFRAGEGSRDGPPSGGWRRLLQLTIPRQSHISQLGSGNNLRSDCSLLVGGLKALCVGPAFEVAPHLPVPAGIGFKNAKL